VDSLDPGSGESTSSEEWIITQVFRDLDYECLVDWLGHGPQVGSSCSTAKYMTPLRTFVSRLSTSTSSFPHLVQALTGNFGERQAFSCQLHLQRIDQVTAALEECLRRPPDARCAGSRQLVYALIKRGRAPRGW
jgi:hypothetical protein